MFDLELYYISVCYLVTPKKPSQLKQSTRLYPLPRISHKAIKKHQGHHKTTQIKSRTCPTLRNTPPITVSPLLRSSRRCHVSPARASNPSTLSTNQTLQDPPITNRPRGRPPRHKTTTPCRSRVNSSVRKIFSRPLKIETTLLQPCPICHRARMGGQSWRMMRRTLRVPGNARFG